MSDHVIVPPRTVEHDIKYLWTDNKTGEQIYSVNGLQVYIVSHVGYISIEVDNPRSEDESLFEIDERL